ncbi:hypothetical protein P9112_014419 [Eukaryota sp. TZLM1-RC]
MPATNELTFALIREFLSRNSYTETLSTFQDEAATSSKITRSQLIKNLGLTKLYVKNKQKPQPLPSLLQCLVENLAEKHSEVTPDSTSHPVEVLGDERIRRLSKPRPPSAGFRNQSSRQKKKVKAKCEDVVVEDLSSVLTVTPSNIQSNIQSTQPINNHFDTPFALSLSLTEIDGLTNAIFGSRPAFLSESWFQGIKRVKDFDPNFSTNYSNLSDYLLYQDEGGPCGVISIFQGFIINLINTKDCSLNVFPTVFAGIIYNCAVKKDELILISVKSEPDPQLRRVLQGSKKLVFSSISEMTQHLQSHWETFATYAGYLSLLLSCVISHGCEAVIEEGGPGRTSLITKYGYCAQEMINLMLTGVASGQVFDNVRDVGGEEMRGVETCPILGFLTVFEYHNYVEVGSFYKNPQSPIWVIMAENHYSVFWKHGGDYLYWDPLGRLSNVVTCHVDKLVDPFFDPHDVPPIELALRTLFKEHSFTWDGLM